MTVKTTKQNSEVDPVKVVRKLVAILKKEREREIVLRRHALDGQKRHTLEEIGSRYGITRERVRQLEKTSLERLQKEAQVLRDVFILLKNVVARGGGIMTNEAIIAEVLRDEATDLRRRSLEFLLILHPDLGYLSDETIFKPSWYFFWLQKDVLTGVINEYVAILEKERKTLSEEALIAKLKHTALYREHKDMLNDSLLHALFRTGSRLLETERGVYGLSEWREINPRSIRDKTYYVLRKVGKPLHFSEIAEEIRKIGFNQRSFTRQAVHNELIRDERFVLIGRGIYALKEWGYHPGTVADVIEQILRQSGRPLHKSEIVTEVLKRRHVKETTIVLNLQDKKRFKRVKKATYTPAA